MDIKQPQPDRNSIFAGLEIRDSDTAFENAIKKGLKKPADYMYMYSKAGRDYFKHIMTRCYIAFPSETMQKSESLERTF
jgi:hypothetical protein